MLVLGLIFIIVIGFFLLIKGADLLVSGASSLARKFNVSELTIGLTIVALGTSAPELVVNVISGSGGHYEVVFGNIIGSNIFNIFLILGISGIIYPLMVHKSTIKKEIPFSFIITIIVFVLINDVKFNIGSQNDASVLDGIILLTLFGGFIYYVFTTMKGNPEVSDEKIEKSLPNWNISLRIIIGLTGLAFGGNLVVNNAVKIAEIFNVSQKMIGLTIVAAGTSLPELATSAVAAFKKQSDIAIGNVIGSNIFNLLLVLGISSVIHPMDYNPALNVDLYILMIGTIMLYVFMFTFNKKKLDRWEAFLYLFTFMVYMVYLFYRQ